MVGQGGASLRSHDAHLAHDLSPGPTLPTSPAARQGIRRMPLPDRLPVKRAMAVHESGKALVASLLRQRTGRLEKVERVSMVPRGRRVCLRPHINV